MGGPWLESSDVEVSITLKAVRMSARAHACMHTRVHTLTSQDAGVVDSKAVVERLSKMFSQVI